MKRSGPLRRKRKDRNVPAFGSANERPKTLRRRMRIKRKSERAILETRLDKMLHEIVVRRDGYKCRRCGHGPEGRQLTAAHIMPKGQYPHMRYRLENVVTMCAYPCHLGARGWHNNPIASYDWAQNELGHALLIALGIAARASNAKVDRTLDELSLRQTLKEMGVEP